MHLRDVDEIMDHRIETGSGQRIVLDIGFRKIARRQIPMPGLQQIAHDLQRHLLIGIEPGIGAGEERFRIGAGGDRGVERLGMRRAAVEQHRRGENPDRTSHP